MTELEAHEMIRDALDGGLTDPNFFVWLNVIVEDSSAEADVIDLDDIVRSTDEWLGTLNPDARPEDGFDELVREYGPVSVRLRAGVWKPEARGRQHGHKVGPHVPVVAYWN